MWFWADFVTVVDPATGTIRWSKKPLPRPSIEETWKFDEVQRIHLSGTINYTWLNFQVRGEENAAGQWPRTGAEKAGLKDILLRLSTAMPVRIEIDEDVRKAFGLESVAGK